VTIQNRGLQRRDEGKVHNEEREPGGGMMMLMSDTRMTENLDVQGLKVDERGRKNHLLHDKDRVQQGAAMRLTTQGRKRHHEDVNEEKRARVGVLAELRVDDLIGRPHRAHEVAEAGMTKELRFVHETSPRLTGARMRHENRVTYRHEWQTRVMGTQFKNQRKRHERKSGMRE
jgi:hypothetical protein